MQKKYTSARLLLEELTLNDATFMRKLVNTPEWIRYIGDRNIKTEAEAIQYIQSIIENPLVQYWVVKTKDTQIPMGIITLIKRPYLEHPDIGFAFLAEYGKSGFAYEAAMTVLKEYFQHTTHTHILATTIKENERSIQLLEKLGLSFLKEIEQDSESLLVYSAMSHRFYKI